MPNLSPAALNVDLWIIVKAMFVIGMFLYLVFSFIVVRQVGHMTKTLQVGFETPLRIFAIAHFVAAVLLLVLAAVVL